MNLIRSLAPRTGETEHKTNADARAQKYYDEDEYAHTCLAAQLLSIDWRSVQDGNDLRLHCFLKAGLGMVLGRSALALSDGCQTLSSGTPQDPVRVGFGEENRVYCRTVFPSGKMPRLYGRRDAHRYNGNWPPLGEGLLALIPAFSPRRR